MKPSTAFICALIAFISCSFAQWIPDAAASPRSERIEKDELCVTNGIVTALPGGLLGVDTPSSRAVVRIVTAQTAEIRFRYLGPSKSSKPLASGELRRQIGLKLRAQDTCNLLYVMWHIEPDAKIAVSIKRNAYKHTHEECGAHGYTNIKGHSSAALPKILPGEVHTLRAELQGNDLIVIADGRMVWNGTLGPAIAAFDGPVGFRTDNARFEFEYFAGSALPGTHSNTPDKRLNACLSSPGD
jgi:hypothetical protein